VGDDEWSRKDQRNKLKDYHRCRVRGRRFVADGSNRNNNT
jgi:hypothetical protein